jgi:hypothetical protein
VAVVINGGTSGSLNPGFSGSGGPVATAIGIVRTTTLTSSLGDALSAQVTYGWDQIAGEARIVSPAPNGSLGTGVTLSMGAGNPQIRFQGTLLEYDTTLAPHAVTAVCKGPLYALEEYENGVGSGLPGGFIRPGLSLLDLLGTPTGTLQQIIAAVLTRAGVSFSLSNFDNPAHVYGLVNPDDFTWGTYESASSYVHRLLEASEGYRLFDSADGNVYLKQITAMPGSGFSAGSATFTLGVDIFGDSSSVVSRVGRRGAVLVEGYDPGDGLGPITTGPVTGNSIFRVSSPLIEDLTFATAISNFWTPIVTRDQKVVRLSTPRDDLIGPAMTIDIDAGPGLGISETMWVKSVTTEINEQGAFSQRLVCVEA